LLQEAEHLAKEGGVKTGDLIVQHYLDPAAAAGQRIFQFHYLATPAVVQLADLVPGQGRHGFVYA
jgi:hypothetical protein